MEQNLLTIYSNNNYIREIVSYSDEQLISSHMLLNLFPNKISVMSIVELFSSTDIETNIIHIVSRYLKFFGIIPINHTSWEIDKMFLYSVKIQGRGIYDMKNFYIMTNILKFLYNCKLHDLLSIVLLLICTQAFPIL